MSNTIGADPNWEPPPRPPDNCFLRFFLNIHFQPKPACLRYPHVPLALTVIHQSSSTGSITTDSSVIQSEVLFKIPLYPILFVGVRIIFVWLCTSYLCGCVFNIYQMIADKSVREGRDSCVTAPGPSRPFQLAFCGFLAAAAGLFNTHTHGCQNTHIVTTHTNTNKHTCTPSHNTYTRTPWYYTHMTHQTFLNGHQQALWPSEPLPCLLPHSIPHIHSVAW